MGIRKIKRYKNMTKCYKNIIFLTFNKFRNKYVIIKKNIYIL